MTLREALSMIGMKVAWMQYAERLAEAEQDTTLDDEWADDAIAVYVDPVYTWAGTRYTGSYR